MKKDLQAWFDWQATSHPKQIDLGLTRIHEVAQRAGLLEWPCPVITVAGTNGKGSTVAALEQVYTAAGYRTGSFTSPHLVHYNERIKLCSKPIGDDAIIAAFEKIDSLRQAVSLSYFEWSFLAALIHFQQAHLDVLILEVGLGGRLDATNIIDCDVGVVTSVDFDHQAYLGDTLEAIAWEKAHIFRPGKPAICGSSEPPATLVQYAREHDIPLRILGQDFICEDLPDGPLLTSNLACAREAIAALQPRLPIADVTAALAKVSLRGRRQVVQGACSIILDVAHNPQSARALGAFLAKREDCYRVAVLGMLADKDTAGVVTPLLPHIDAWVVVPLADERALPVDDLAQALRGLTRAPVSQASSPAAALRDASCQRGADDCIVVLGSFHTVGAVLDELEAEVC